jgi:hypothetical protein
MDDWAQSIKDRFPVGLKGIFTVKPFFETVTKDKFFYIAALIAVGISVIPLVFTDKQIYYIDMINEIIISVIPALLGLSLAGFAIVVSQVSEDSLLRMGDLNIEKSNDYSLYQKLNAVFSITVLAQIVPLVIAVLVRLIKPLSFEIPVNVLMATAGNIITLFVELLFFLYALFSIVDLIKNIFTTSQMVNLIVFCNKMKTIRRARRRR